LLCRARTVWQKAELPPRQRHRDVRWLNVPAVIFVRQRGVEDVRFLVQDIVEGLVVVHDWVLDGGGGVVGCAADVLSRIVFVVDGGVCVDVRRPSLCDPLISARGDGGRGGVCGAARGASRLDGQHGRVIPEGGDVVVDWTLLAIGGQQPGECIRHLVHSPGAVSDREVEFT